MPRSFTTEPMETVPLASNADGVVLVANTRVTLDSLLGAFRDGATPEEIVSQYPVLDLADVYAVLGYCLRHGSEVEEYLTSRCEAATRAREETEARFPSEGIRARLMARRAYPDLDE